MRVLVVDGDPLTLLGLAASLAHVKGCHVCGAVGSARAARVLFGKERVQFLVMQYPLPDEDILGWFQVRAGQIVDGSYRPNPRHKIQGAYGITAALGGMRQAMVNELIARQTR